MTLTLDRLKKFNIQAPVIAGIMPILNLSQMQRFVDMCGASIPNKLIEKLEGKNKEDMYKIGVEYAIEQCEELIQNDVSGLHFTLSTNTMQQRILFIKGLNIFQNRLFFNNKRILRKKKVLDCYKKAIDKKYRFFSFGDAVFIY